MPRPWRLRRASPAAVLVAMVVIILAWTTTVAAPETSEGAFDMPTLTVEPISVSPPASIIAPVPVVETTTTTRAPLPPLVFDPIAPGRVNLGGDHHAEESVPAFGIVEIPKIGLVHPIFEGLDESHIHWGPGHWPGSAQPGQAGNAVFAGHRVTHTRPFLDIDLLVPGDQMTFKTNDGTAIYEVTEHLIVTPDDTWISQPTTDATVTLFACHPKHSARQRYVVRGKLVGWSPRA